MGGKDKFEKFADAHFNGGHNLHTNEPSHHIVRYNHSGPS